MFTAVDLIGHWFVAPLGQHSPAALVTVAGPEDEGVHVEVHVEMLGRRTSSAASASIAWDSDAPRGSITLRPRHGATENATSESREGWFMEGADSARLIGADAEGGPLLAARRLAAVPESLLGEWSVAELGGRKARRAQP